MELEHVELTVHGLRLHAVCAGPASGELVVLLHGFPDFWYGWRKQIPVLAAAGYRVIAPDQRGYNSSDKPAGRRAYGIEAIGEDVLGILALLGHARAHVVGHDWGAIIAWWLAIRHPTRLSSVVPMNVPHPLVMDRHLKRDPLQVARSWYIFFFQLPSAPEWLLSRDGARPFARFVAESANPGSFPEEVLEIYREAWLQPGAMTAMLNWYRGVVLARPPVPRDVRVRVPALVIWGANDLVLERSMAAESVELCDQGRLELISDASHWVKDDCPNRVNALLLEFLESVR